ncbi:hypothetical protein HDU67_009050 [Dinochytrium kinnereticum]|nr:hypothetical protein HDU67_009050 [Dinochytrium kinnereticum]
MATLEELQNEANRAGPDEPDPQYRLASHILDHAALLPSDLRSSLISEAVSIIDRLALPDNVFTGSGGHVPAILLAANLLITGIPFQDQPVVPNYPMAFSLYLRAVDGGSPTAAHNAALLLEHDRVSLIASHDQSTTASKSKRNPSKQHMDTSSPSKRNPATDAAINELHITAAAANHPGSLLWLHNRLIKQAETLQKSDPPLAQSTAIDSLHHLHSAALASTPVHPEPLHALAMLLLAPPKLLSSPSARTRIARDVDDVARVLDPTGVFRSRDDKSNASALALIRIAAALGHLPSVRFLGIRQGGGASEPGGRSRSVVRERGSVVTAKSEPAVRSKSAVRAPPKKGDVGSAQSSDHSARRR